MVDWKIVGSIIVALLIWTVVALGISYVGKKAQSAA